jgi:DHA1 family bicyclomycin/chloramphenicol resistance-like MFS transporter
MATNSERSRASTLRVANLIAQMAYGLVAMTICLPSSQEWGAIFSARPSTVQLTFSGFVLTYGALQLVYGPLSDRHGRRPLMLGGLALAGIASVAGAFAPTIELLVAARVVQGAGCAAGMVLGRAAVQDLFAGPERTRVMAYVGMAMGLCPPLATVVGGQLHASVGWQANFVLLAVLAALLFVAAWRGLPAGAPQRTAVHDEHWLRAMGSSYARVLREPSITLNVLVLSLTVGAFYAYLAAAPLVLGGYGVGPARVGFYIMVPPLSYIVGNFATTRLVRRIGERPVLLVGQMLTVGGIALMLVLALAGWKTALAFVLPLVLLGLGNGLLVPPALAATVGVIPALAGAAAAVAGVMQQLVGALGGYAAGWVVDRGAVGLGWLMLGFGASAFAAQLWLLRSGGRPGPA